jgi:8-oxo-dGTP diphosphatase
MHTYSDPARDPRKPTVSVVYAVQADGEVLAGDDAARVEVFAWGELPELCFDHGQILSDFRSGLYAPSGGN